MSIKSTFFAAFAVSSFALPAFADGIMVQDPYARVSSMMSKSGAAFMTIINHSGEADHLVGASSDIADRVELHTHMENADGVMKMVHVEDGFELPQDGRLDLQRGGKHVMFLGLHEALEDGDRVSVTLHFETAGDVVVEVPVDLTRKPKNGMMDHSNMNHGEMGHGMKKPSN